MIGTSLPSVTLYECPPALEGACPSGPVAVDMRAESAGKTVLLFALPGAFTPTCSAQHLPGYVHHAAALRAKGVDEIWCVSVNDAFVMRAWGDALGVGSSIRMLADGNADLAGALGLTLDLRGRGMGIRSQRFALLIRDGCVVDAQVEEPGKLVCSRAENMLALL
ncbi:peroxiredoxin [Inhella inkyongensis]|uniref:Glutathione-dependent peroxiredoxin n=1 Tax=Inhella inkyongensis TaxID=392593 RepID=A0A840SD88_9BURK|nr:peroxiredoxin [Inhella inkyongensis]MBB5206269.1 peroxiredoxin [Inhella inkyongensis]